MDEFDKATLDCFLKNQLQLFPKKVAEDYEEAEEFLLDCMAVVLEDADEVKDYFEEVGVDTEGMRMEEILSQPEIFAVGDGRYLVLEV